MQLQNVTARSLARLGDTRGEIHLEEAREPVGSNQLIKIKVQFTFTHCSTKGRLCPLLRDPFNFFPISEIEMKIM